MTVAVDVEVKPDPEDSAEAAGLRYVHDDRPGITRHRRGKGFTYRDAKGEAVTDARTLARIKSLAIPPAWESVWICPLARGHIQATGRDARGRKQYRYHPQWREARDEAKYGRMVAFGRALPALRERVDADLGLRGLPREKVLAAVVRLLDETMVRVGNDEYAKDNASYGLTTILNRHAKVEGSKVRFRFVGKSGVKHDVGLRDRRIAAVVKKCQHLPGHELFGYVDEEGVERDVGSDDVNAYLREVTGQPFTAKDFRTWGGTVEAAVLLSKCDRCETATAAKRCVADIIKRVAKRLRNTPAVCRKCYVHPKVIEGFGDGTLHEAMGAPVKLDGLRDDERAVLGMLEAIETRAAA
ncbi:MAG: DNA topoisomerase IB [Polyangiales bacterium]